LLALLDGTRTLDELRKAINAASATPLAKLAGTGALEKALDDIARNAMLVLP
jgi:hypothetical protein